MEKLLLKLVDICSPIYKKLGIDFNTMKRIVELKLRMDKRRNNSFTMNKKKDEERNNTIYMILLNGFFGIFLGLVFFIPAPLIMTSNIYIGGILFLAIMTIVSDFSSVLLDIRDRNILLPRPISAKTLNAAKITHVCIYLLQLMIPLSFTGILVGTAKFGVIFLLIILIELIIMSMFIVVISALLYSLILKFFSGEKLKDIINYFQIVLSLILAVGYQVIIRIIDFDAIGSYAFKWWHSLIPSMWFAAPFELIIKVNVALEIVVLSIIAVIIPIALILIYALFIGPNFEKNLSKMHSSEIVNRDSKICKEKRLRKLASIVCKNREEKESFIFTTNMISKERSLKLRVYPSIALGLAFPLIFGVLEFKKYGSIQKSYENSYGGYAFLFIYMAAFLLSCSASYIGNSDSYKGAWIYTVLPIKDISSIKKGAIKAATYKLIFMPYIIMAVIYLFLGKLGVIVDLAIVFNVIIICYCLFYKMVGTQIPFSESYEMIEQSKNIGPTFLIIFVSMIFAAIHGFIFKAYILIKIGYLVLTLLIMIIMLRKMIK